MEFIRRIILLFYTLVLTVLCSVSSFADGSKDLYLKGVRGNRAFLITRQDVYADINFPFPTLGTHFVYVREGEVLAVATSALYNEEGAITITKSTGEVLRLDQSNRDSSRPNRGLIRTRDLGQEQRSCQALVVDMRLGRCL